MIVASDCDCINVLRVVAVVDSVTVAVDSLRLTVGQGECGAEKFCESST